VAFVGGVATSDFFRGRLREALAGNRHRQYAVVDPVLAPAAGAVLTGLRRLGGEVDDTVVKRLATADG